MILAPIALFVYNRLSCLEQTVKALQNNLLAKESELFVFSDGPKDDEDSGKVLEIRKLIRKIDGFKKVEIIERRNNLGLSSSIIDGVTSIVNSHDKIIVLEDDLLSSPYFLKFMNDALSLYSDEERVSSICGFFCAADPNITAPFFLKIFSSIGWATWKGAWRFFEKEEKKLLKKLEDQKLQKDFDLYGSYPFTRLLRRQSRGVVDSWAIRWYASSFLRNTLNLYPPKLLIRHIGGDIDSTHNIGPYKKMYDVDVSEEPVMLHRIKIEENISARAALERHFRKTMPNIFVRGLFKLRRIYNKRFFV